MMMRVNEAQEDDVALGIDDFGIGRMDPFVTGGKRMSFVKNESWLRRGYL
jgi:hypothetical protein